MKHKLFRSNLPILFALLLIGLLSVVFTTGKSRANAQQINDLLATAEITPAKSNHPAAPIWQIETVDSDGNVGKYNSLAVDSALKPHISYYDETNGDLVYARYDGTNWNTQMVDGAGNLGQYTSLALNQFDQPRISYYGTTGVDVWNLFFASFNGSAWDIATVDDSTNQVGLYSSLALTDAGDGRISYLDNATGVLRYAYFKSGAWYPATIGSLSYVKGHSSLALNSTGQPRVSYLAGSDVPILHYISYGNGNWVNETVDDYLPPGSDGVGQYSSLALDTNDTPHISYCRYDNTGTCNSLRYAYFNGSTWISTTVASGAGMGAYTSLALDASDHPHISYYSGSSLNYAYFDGSDWFTQVVDDSVAGVGQFTSLVLDVLDRPHISYYDATNGDLKYAIGQHPACIPLASVSTSGPHGIATGSVYTFTAAISPTNVAGPFLYTWQATDQTLTDVYTDSVSYSMSYSWVNPGIKAITVTVHNCAASVMTNHDLATSAIPLVDIPPEIHRMAARHLEDARGTSAAPEWGEAYLGTDIRPLYRPDVAGVAYYEFPVLAPSAWRSMHIASLLAESTPAGFIIVSAGEHDYPIAHWASTGTPPSTRLEQQAAAKGKLALKFYKLDVLSYAAEDEAGEEVAYLGDRLFKITGMDPAWLDDPQITSSEWNPSMALNDDLGADQITGTFVITGPTAPPASLEFSAWESWSEMKTGYSDSYGVLAESVRRNASELWLAESAARQYGQPLRKGETHVLPTLWAAPAISLSGPGVDFIETSLIPRSDLAPLLQISVVDSTLGEVVPFSIDLSYPNGVTESVGFLIVEQYQVFLPMVGREFDAMATLPYSARSQSNALLFAPEPFGPATPANTNSVNASSWHEYYAGTAADQCWYTQIPYGEAPNTSACTSGCGATGWAMLFGWIDNMAADTSGNEYWLGRWGLYRFSDGGDTIAPKTWGGSLIKDMTWEIRNDIGTFCWDTDQAPTYPWNMEDVNDYVNGRSAVSIHTDYSVVGIGWDYIMEAARDTIAYADDGGKTPVVVGMGWLSHYPLAYGYRYRYHTYCVVPEQGWWCANTTERQFWVNMGWGGTKEWIPSDTWFAGRVTPKSAWNNDVGVYRPSNKKWYYDYNLDGDTDEGPLQGLRYDSRPFVGDFNRDNILGDVGVYDPDNGIWMIDYKHNKSIDNSFTVSWADLNWYPVALDYDRDGFVDDLGAFRPESGTWIFDVDADNSWAYASYSWGLPGDLPVAGDFDSDGYADDLGLFRPSTGTWYFDYNHDGSTNSTNDLWGFPGDLPVAGDFDKDGMMDDVGLFRPSTGMWYYDYNHNALPTDKTSGPWGLPGDLPIAGNFETR